MLSVAYQFESRLWAFWPMRDWWNQNENVIPRLGGRCGVPRDRQVGYSDHDAKRLEAASGCGWQDRRHNVAVARAC